MKVHLPEKRVQITSQSEAYNRKITCSKEGLAYRCFDKWPFHQKNHIKAKLI